MGKRPLLCFRGFLLSFGSYNLDYSPNQPYFGDQKIWINRGKREKRRRRYLNLCQDKPLTS